MDSMQMTANRDYRIMKLSKSDSKSGRCEWMFVLTILTLQIPAGNNLFF